MTFARLLIGKSDRVGRVLLLKVFLASEPERRVRASRVPGVVICSISRADIALEVRS